MWILCPASVTKARGRKRTATAYTREGTLVHMMAEAMLRGYNSGVTQMMIEKEVEVEGETVFITDEMTDAAATYANHVIKLDENADALFIEKIVKVSGLAEPLFGTADAIVVNGSHLDLVDLKYGQGVSVSPIQNTQLMVYALGAMELVGPFIETVTLHIVQPRAGGIKKWDVTADELLQWEQDVLVPAALQVAANDPTEVVGDHCRWCVRAGECESLAQHAMTQAKTAFGKTPPDPGTLDNDYLGRVLEQAEIISAWVSKVRAEVSQRIDTGQTVTGWKLVPKRAMRKWVDEKKAIDAFDVAGFDLRGLTKLRTPAQVEKEIGKFYDIDPLVVKESSGTTLARDFDEREAIDTTPQNVFSSNL